MKMGNKNQGGNTLDERVKLAEKEIKRERKKKKEKREGGKKERKNGTPRNRIREK